MTDGHCQHVYDHQHRAGNGTELRRLLLPIAVPLTGSHSRRASKGAGLQAGSGPALLPEVSLPVIENGFDRRLHPHWPALQARTRAWLLEQRLLSRGRVARFADDLRYTDLVAGYYLGAPDEVLTAIANISAWFFFFDDRHDRDVVHGRVTAWRRLCTRLHEAIETPGPHLRHPDPLVSALADCLAGIYSHLGDAWNTRFAEHFHPVIDAYDQEFRNRARSIVPTVTAYVELRRLTFAHQLWTDLLELAAHRELLASVRDHPAFQRAALATQDFSAWYNDLCSLPKELAGGELHNLGISLMHHEELSERQATAEIHRRVSQCVDTFLVAEPQVLQLAERTAAGGTARDHAHAAAIESCLGNMRNWFSSVYWFHHESGRYRVDDWDDRATPPYLDDVKGRM